MIRQTRLNQERIDVATRRQVLGAGLAGAAGLAGVGLITTFGAEPAFATGSSVTILNTTATLTTSGFYGCDSGGGAFTVTLPSAVGFTSGLMTISKYTDDTNIITIATVSSQTIGTNVAGGPNAVQVGLLNQGDAFDLYSDGTNWQFARQPQVLGVTTFINPSVVESSTTTLAAVNTTDLVVQGLVPPSGQVRSRLSGSCWCSNSSTQQSWDVFAIVSGGSFANTKAKNGSVPDGAAVVNSNIFNTRPCHEVVFGAYGTNSMYTTSLVPGTLILVYWAWKATGGGNVYQDSTEMTMVLEAA